MTTNNTIPAEKAGLVDSAKRAANEANSTLEKAAADLRAANNRLALATDGRHAGPQAEAAIAAARAEYEMALHRHTAAEAAAQAATAGVAAAERRAAEITAEASRPKPATSEELDMALAAAVDDMRAAGAILDELRRHVAEVSEKQIKNENARIELISRRMDIQEKALRLGEITNLRDVLEMELSSAKEEEQAAAENYQRRVKAVQGLLYAKVGVLSDRSAAALADFRLACATHGASPLVAHLRACREGLEGAMNGGRLTSQGEVYLAEWERLRGPILEQAAKLDAIGARLKDELAKFDEEVREILTEGGAKP